MVESKMNIADKNLINYKSIFETSPYAILITNLDGTILYANISASKLFGYSQIEIIGLCRDELIDFKDHYSSVISKETSFHGELTISKKDGFRFHAELSSNLFKDSDEQNILMIIKDLTQDELVQKSLKEQEENYRILVEGHNDLVIKLDTEYKFCFVSASYCEMFSKTKDELIGSEFLLSVREDERESAENALEKLFNYPYKSRHEQQAETAKGCICLEWSNKAVRNNEDNITGIISVGRDITRQNKVANALQSSEFKYRNLYENMMDAFVHADQNGYIQTFNEQYKQMLGYETEELLKMNYKDVTPERWHDYEAEIVDKQLYTKGYTDIYEKEYIKKDGTIFPVELRGYLLRNEQGQPDSLWGVVRDISERKKFEKALIEKEKRYRTLYSSMNEGVAIHEVIYDNNDAPVDYEIVDVNDAYEEILGIAKEDVLGKKASEVYGSESPPYLNIYYEVLNSGEPTQFVTYFEPMDKHFKISVFSLYEGTFVTLFEDLTIHKKAEKKLELALKYNRSLIEASLDPLVTIGPDGKITDVNNSTETVTGVIREELIGTDFSDYFTEPEKAREGYQQVFKEGIVRNYPLEIKHKNGQITPVLYNASIYRDENNEIIGVFAAARDITERKKADEKIKRLANAVESSNDAIITKSLHGCILSWNKGAEQTYGYLADDVLGKNIDILAPDKLKNEIYEFIQKIEKNESISHYETQRLKKDGTLIDVSITLSPVINSSGELVAISNISRDITLNKNIERELELASKYNRSLIEASLDPLVTIGPDGKITDVNNATEMITGCLRKELIGTDFTDYFTETMKARKGYQQVFDKGYVRDYPLEIQSKNGIITPVLYNASIYNDEHGDVIGVFAAARDITQIKNAENDIKASLHEKEILLKEIHHRVKNNLQIISSLLNLQTHYVKDDKVAVDVLKESQNRVRSMAMIHEKLYQSKNFSHVKFDDYLNRLVSDLLYSYATTDNIMTTIDVEDIKLNIETAIPCGLITSELVSNSLKYAFPNEMGGRITVSLKQLGSKYELVIGDNGIGVPKGFNYKNTDSFGLKIVTSLVDQIDGEIRLEKGHGTIFTIIFKELEYRERI